MLRIHNFEIFILRDSHVAEYNANSYESDVALPKTVNHFSIKDEKLVQRDSSSGHRFPKKRPCTWKTQEAAFARQ